VESFLKKLSIISSLLLVVDTVVITGLKDKFIYRIQTDCFALELV
jgi:hypothetical protein